VRSIVALGASEPGQVLDVDTGEALPCGGKVLLDAQEIVSRSRSRGTERLPSDLAAEGKLLQVAAADPERTADSRLILFNCWAGLSLSELIATGVEDVDLVAGTLSIRRTLVARRFKVPNELSRIRTVDLIVPARELLTLILAEAKDAEPTHITVVQRDNITKKHERVRFLFRSCCGTARPSATGSPPTSKSRCSSSRRQPGTPHFREPSTIELRPN
jgi:integrase